MEENKQSKKEDLFETRRIDQIKELYPQAVKEIQLEDEKGNYYTKEAIDFDVLRNILSDDIIPDRMQRYELLWSGKNQAAKLGRAKTIDKVYKPVKEKSVDFDTTKNLYIEGDNLQALNLLMRHYEHKIKMIYIDPPYNTGNDFVYNDKFSDNQKDYDKKTGAINKDGVQVTINKGNEGKYHTNWLNMMYPRLMLARDLLTEDGVIFISIDDNEQANLKKMCDEIFGDSNFISILHVEMSLTQGMKVGAAQKGKIVKNGEFVLVYAKNGSAFTVNKILYDGVDGYDEHFSIYLKKSMDKIIMSDIKSMIEDNKELKTYFDAVKLDYSFKSFVFLINSDKKFKELIYKSYSNKIFQSMLANIQIQDEDVKSRLSKGEVASYSKYMLHQVESGKIRQLLPLSSTIGYTDDYDKSFSRRRIRGDMWKGFYQDMMNVAKEGEVDFKNGKKPVRLIKQLAEWGTNSECIVLDFFSGSATTAHAVMQLNAEDGGNRKFIMVQIAEPCDENSEAKKAGYNTITDIGEERIRRAGKKIKEEHPLTTQNLDTGFRVLKIDDSPLVDTNLSQFTLEAAISNIKANATPLDLLFKVMLDHNMDLSLDITESKKNINKIEYTYYKVGDKSLTENYHLVACFDKDVPEQLFEEMIKLNPVFFATCDRSFKTDNDKLTFRKIVRIYAPTLNDDAIIIL